jgi:hypothetical protein
MRKKYRLTKWSVVCRPKDQGGLGVHDLQVKNGAFSKKITGQVVNWGWPMAATIAKKKLWAQN